MSLNHFFIQLEDSYTYSFEESLQILEDLDNDLLTVDDVLGIYKWGYEDFSMEAMLDLSVEIEDISVFMIEYLGYDGVSLDETLIEWYLDYFYLNGDDAKFDTEDYEAQFIC